MKAYFVKSSVDSVEYLRGKIVANHPVNISICKSVRKGDLRWYPDNVGLPTIEFNGSDTAWTYENEKTRDADYERIINNRFYEEKENEEKIKL